MTNITIVNNTKNSFFLRMSFTEGILYEGIKRKNETLAQQVFFLHFCIKNASTVPKNLFIEQRAFLGKEFKQPLCRRI